MSTYLNACCDGLIHFQNSPLSACFIESDDQSGTFKVLNHANCSPIDENCIGYHEGYRGSVDAGCELFRILAPHSIAVGDHGTILNLSIRACSRPYPTRCAANISTDGYRIISRKIDAPCHRISRLMGIAWLPRLDDATEIDHIDGCKTHDVIENLRWVNHSDNMINATYSPHHRWADDDRVLCLPIQCQGEPAFVHPSLVASIVQSSNISHVLVRHTRRCCNGWYLMINPTEDDIYNACTRYNCPDLIQPALEAFYGDVT